MTDRTCPRCGVELNSSICASCGCDVTVEVVEMARPPLAARLWAAAWRLLVLGLLIGVPVIGSHRLLEVGPGPDPGTTLRWLVLGDGGRAAELVTLHRAYEIASASARFGLREFEAPVFEGEWETVLGPHSTMHARGWMPLLFVGATTGAAPASVEEFFEVRAVDGWSRPWRITTRALPRGVDYTEDPQVAADLEAVLNRSFALVGSPEFGEADWLRLQMESAGADGVFDSGDDLLFISYMPVSFTVHLSGDRETLQRRLDEAYFHGRHFFRYEGAHSDLIDARLLAEFRMLSLS